jgi:hypothetical protein
MNPSELTGKITPAGLDKCMTLLNETYTYNIGGVEVHYTSLYSFFNGYLASLFYQNDWQEGGSLEVVDFRFQTFARLETHALSNHLSIISNFNNLEDMINECLSLGYSLKMAINAAVIMRSVALKISYWDRVFYSIEYYVQRMNDHFSFMSNLSTHRKSHYFTKMLEYFDLADSTITARELVGILSKHCPEELQPLNSFLADKIPNRSIQFSKFYEYAATLRNSLHNNGYSNKTLNNLDIGLSRFENITAGHSINCMSLYHLLTLSVALTEVFQRITEKTLDLHPGLVIPDPFIADMRSHLNAIGLQET